MMAASAAPAHPDHVIVVGSVQPSLRDWAARASMSSSDVPPAVDSVEVAVPGLSALPADLRKLTLSSDRDEMRDNLHFCYSVGGWATLGEAYRNLAATNRTTLLNLAADIVQSMVDELMPVMSDIETVARKEIDTILSTSTATLEHDTPQLLKGATLDVVKGSTDGWRLADTTLVRDLFDALEVSRSEIAELKDAQSSKGYIDSLREIPSDVSVRAAQRVATAHLALVRTLGPVAEKHPLVHWLLGLVPHRNDSQNATRIAEVIQRIAKAIDTVAEEAARTTSWPASGQATAAQFRALPWSPYVRDNQDWRALVARSPFASAIQGTPKGPWSYPLVVQRTMDRMRIQPSDVVSAAAQEVLHATDEDAGLAVTLSVGAVALDIACPIAGLAANLVLAAWPLLADWHKYTIADAGALASVDGATPISLPGDLHHMAADVLQLIGAGVDGWKGLALGGAALVVSVADGS